MQTTTANRNGDRLALTDLAFLYPRKLEPDEPRPMHDRSFFYLPSGSDVPPKYPNKAPPRTLWDLIVAYLFEHELSAVALASRTLCRAVRKRRFRILSLHPHMDHARLVEVLRPDTVLPFIRQLIVNGRLREPGMISPSRQADHRWLNTPGMVQLLADVSAHSPVEFLLLQSLSWGDLAVDVRRSLRAMPHVRALMVHDVDFWTSNQYLQTLNAYRNLQYLSLWHPDFHALTHVDSQLQRETPLLLTELVVGCAYTGLLMEWLLGGGRRTVLAVEEMMLDSRDMYRDDARLAKVLRRAAPWLKRFYYMEYASGGAICEGAVYGTLLQETDPPQPWSPPEIASDVGALEDDEEDGEVMDVDYDDPSDVMDEDPGSDAAVGSHTHQHIPTSSASVVQPQSPLSLTQSSLPTHPGLRLPDDESGIEYSTRSGDLAAPPFSSTQERGYRAFAEELSRRIDTPMLEAIDARINWTSPFSLLTLKMLCQLTYAYEDFYRFDIRIVFASPELFESAPWRVIDNLLARASRRLPGGAEREVDDDEDDGSDDLHLTVSVKGWNVDGRDGRARMRDLRRNLPRTSAEDVLELGLHGWYHQEPLWAPGGMLE